MQPTISYIDVVTHSGRQLQVMQVQKWIDTSSKDDPGARAPGQKVLRTVGGQAIAYNGSVFTLPNGETFDPPAA